MAEFSFSIHEIYGPDLDPIDFPWMFHHKPLDPLRNYKWWIKAWRRIYKEEKNDVWIDIGGEG